MSRTSRLLELLELLRRRHAPVSGRDLADELGVSIRTLYRDIATLQAQGAEIRGEPGLGYVLRPGFTLPPLMFSEDELEALVLGSRWVAVRGDERLAAAANHAVAKLRAVLPAELRAHVDAATLTVPAVSSAEPAKIDVAIIRVALRKEHRLVISYCDTSGACTKRTVWPVLLGFFDRVQVLVAWCELRKDYRAFRVDRVQSAQGTGRPYPRRRTEMVKEWRQTQGISTTARN